MFQRSNAAYERAISLDPNRVGAASLLIVNRVERGELGRAYGEASALVQRRPLTLPCACYLHAGAATRKQLLQRKSHGTIRACN